MSSKSGSMFKSATMRSTSKSASGSGPGYKSSSGSRSGRSKSGRSKSGTQAWSAVSCSGMKSKSGGSFRSVSGAGISMSRPSGSGWGSKSGSMGSKSGTQAWSAVSRSNMASQSGMSGMSGSFDLESGMPMEEEKGSGMMIIIIVVVAILVAVVIYFAFFNKGKKDSNGSSKQEGNSGNNTPSKPPVNPGTGTKTPTSGTWHWYEKNSWKKYSTTDSKKIDQNAGKKDYLLKLGNGTEKDLWFYINVKADGKGTADSITHDGRVHVTRMTGVDKDRKYQTCGSKKLEKR